MMTARQFRLTKLMEECSEVIKECAKLQAFGDRKHEGKHNSVALREECMDVLVCIRLLERMGVIQRITLGNVRKHYAGKRQKITKRTAEIIEAGNVEPELIGYIPELL